MKTALLLLLGLFSTGSYAAEISSSDFSFQLPGDWKISVDKNGTQTAQRIHTKEQRAFILSIPKPRDIEEGSQMLLAWQNIMEEQGQKDKRLKLDKTYGGYKTVRGAPFKYIAFSRAENQGFFIGASLGSNFGVILITYEGNRDLRGAIKELNSILDSMKYKGS